MLIDKYLKDFDFRKYHSRDIRAGAQDVHAAIETADFYQSKVIRLLFALRGLPDDMFSPEGFSKVGIMELEKKEGQESVLGAIFNPIGFRPVWVTPEEYRKFEGKGYVKVAMNLLVTGIDDNCSLLSSETRVRCTSLRARVAFTPYWLLMNRSIGLVRTMMLRRIQQEAEKAVPAARS